MIKEQKVVGIKIVAQKIPLLNFVLQLIAGQTRVDRGVTSTSSTN